MVKLRPHVQSRLHIRLTLFWVNIFYLLIWSNNLFKINCKGHCGPPVINCMVKLVDVSESKKEFHI